MATFVIPDSAVEWLLSGERGISSNAIFERMTGLPAIWAAHRPSPPCDHYDLRRCRLLLEHVPEFAARIGEMASVPGWGGIVAEWSTLCALMDSEAPSWRAPDYGDATPLTYAAMRKALEVR